MHFNMEWDTGDRITLYVVPDGYSAVPSIRVESGGATILEMTANHRQDALVAAGRHETGMCGFIFDDGMIPELSELSDLSVWEPESGLLIYRRPLPEHIRQHALHFCTGLIPQRHVDDVLSPYFQYAATRIEAHGHETAMQLFELHKVESSFLSGRVLFKNYEVYIEKGVRCFTCLSEPHFAMAERILILAKLAQMPGAEQLLGKRDAFMFQAAIEFAASLPLEDGKGLRRAFRSQPPDIALAFVDPVVRLLTSTAPNEMARAGSLAWALDTLASFDAVGIRSHEGDYLNMIAALFGLDPRAFAPRKTLPKVTALADLLREEAGVDALIERDLELYNFVEGALMKCTDR